MGSSSQRLRDTLRRRCGQGIRSLNPSTPEIQFPDHVRVLVSQDVVERWATLPAYDRQHMHDVAADLQNQGCGTKLVLAGLLHDIGKPACSPTLSRITHVILHRLGTVPARWLQDCSCSWPGIGTLRALIVHPQSGADFLASHELPDQIVWLVRHHHEDIPDHNLKVLEAADDRH